MPASKVPNHESDPAYDSLVRRLTQLRTAAGDSQATLAEKLGQSQGNVGHYESRRNNIPLRTALRWAAVYGKSMAVVDAADAMKERRLQPLLAQLSGSDLDTLIRVAEALPRLSTTMKELIGRIADES